MDRTKLLKLIMDHLKKTGEGRYAWGARVMGDKAYLWKMENSERQPFRATVAKIKASIARANRRKQLRKNQKARGY